MVTFPRKQWSVFDEADEDFSIFRLCEGCSQARLLGPGPGHHSVPPVLENLYSVHVQAPLQGLWAGCVWALLQPHQACALAGLGPPSQSV